jgi:hypothetical protein
MMTGNGSAGPHVGRSVCMRVTRPPARHSIGGGALPTRRIFELTLVEIALARPVFGAARLWAHKRLGESQPGSFLHGLAEVMVVLL